MGYTTEFRGEFRLNKKLDDSTHELLTKLNKTRRMARDIKGYGVEGEFFVDGTGDFGQGDSPDVIDRNRPPSSQPSLWCGWEPSSDGKYIAWDGAEKFYHYIEWIKYLIKSILAPRGYILNGQVQWRGEDWEDHGVIQIIQNEVLT